MRTVDLWIDMLKDNSTTMCIKPLILSQTKTLCSPIRLSANEDTF